MPRTYRERYWGAIGAAVLSSFILWGRTFQADRNLIYVVAAFFLFVILTLAVTRIVLHPDRIESINLLARRSLPRQEIDRLEIRENSVKGKTVKSYVLIPERRDLRSLVIPSNIAMDQFWFDWMAGIPETAVSAPEERSRVGTGKVILASIFLVAVLAIPIALRGVKPYFDVLSLALPWLGYLFIFTSDQYKVDGWESSGLRIILVPLFAFGVPAIYLVTIGAGMENYVAGADSVLRLWICAAMAGFALILLRLSPIDTLNAKRDLLATVLAFGGLYGFGAATTLNELLDNSPPQFTPVPVESRYMQTGKNAGPYFKLAPWGAETQERAYHTSRYAYDHVNAICAELHSGFIGMRWYRLSDACSEVKATK